MSPGHIVDLADPRFVGPDREVVPDLEGRELRVGDRIYDHASGLAVTVVADNVAVYVNADDGRVLVVSRRSNGCWMWKAPLPDGENPYNLPVVGWANVARQHPQCSEIGWEQTNVFQSALMYVESANALVRDREQESVYQMFKDLVAEARKPASLRGDLLIGCGIPPTWFFSDDSKRKGHGLYDHYTDEYIDGLSVDECRFRMIRFIAACYSQR